MTQPSRTIKANPDGTLRVSLNIIAESTDTIDLIPPQTIQIIQDVLEAGRRSGKCRYERGEVTVNDCVSHALRHLCNHLEGDASEDHLAHAFTRLMMALSIERFGLPGKRTAKADMSAISAEMERLIDGCTGGTCSP